MWRDYDNMNNWLIIKVIRVLTKKVLFTKDKRWARLFEEEWLQLNLTPNNFKFQSNFKKWQYGEQIIKNSKKDVFFLWQSFF